MSTQRKWLILVAMALMVTLGQFDKNAISVAAVPISKEFGFSPAEMGMVISCFFISYTALNLLGGFIADAYGARKVATVVTLLWSAFTGITGFAWSFSSLLAIRFIFGAAEGAFPPTNNLIVAELFPVEKRAFPKSFITGCSALGIGLGAIAITQITHFFGWRNAFFLYCFVGFMLAGMFYWFSRTMPKPAGKGLQKSGISFKAVFADPLIWRMIPIQFASGAFMWGLNSWMPSYWMNVKGLKLTSMGFASAIPMVVAACSIFLVGYLLDKYWGGKEKWVITIGATCAAISTYLTFIAPNVTMGIICMTIASMTSGAMTQTVFICIIKYFNQGTIGAACGLANGSSQFAGIMTPAIMGYILTVTGGNYTAVFGSVIAVLFIAALIALTIKIPKREQIAATACDCDNQ